MTKTPSEIVDIVLKTDFTTIHQRGGITFHPLANPSLFAIFSAGIEKVVPGGSYDPMIVLFYNETTHVFMPRKGYKRTGLAALKLVESDPLLVKSYRKRFLARSAEFIKEVKGIAQRLPTATDKEIVKMYQSYLASSFDTAILGEPLPFAVNHELSRYLEGILSRGISDRAKVLEYYTLLVSPTKPSFINREEIELNKIIRRIQKDKKAQEIVSKPLEIAVGLLPESTLLESMIQKHQRSFFWVPHDYVGMVWGVREILEKVQHGLSNPSDPAQALKDVAKRQELAFKSLIKQKMITPMEKKMFLAAQDATLLNDLKKEKLSEVHYYINLLFKEVAQRKQADFWNVIFLTGDEIEGFLQGKIPESELAARRKASAYVNTGYHMYCVTGKGLEAVARHVLKESDSEVVELSGMCASPGNYIGVARVMKNPAEAATLKKGEILVAGMTSPEYVPAMKKAGAIITDEGGITSHAAIVSRELNIPCIIGTKVATKVLKDGDLIEIHGTTGAIKIMRRADERS